MMKPSWRRSCTLKMKCNWRQAFTNARDVIISSYRAPFPIRSRATILVINIILLTDYDFLINLDIKTNKDTGLGKIMLNK